MFQCRWSTSTDSIYGVIVLVFLFINGGAPFKDSTNRVQHKSNASFNNIYPDKNIFLNSISSRRVSRKRLKPRIVGGNVVNPPSRYPFMVSIVSKEGTANPQHVCGGTLVAPNVVLSAAHCYNLADAIQIGRFDIGFDSTETFQELQIIEKRIHERYNADSQDFDYMMVKLESSVNSIYTPVSLDDGKINLENEDEFLVMGWGKESESADTGSTVLRETAVDLFDSNECNRILPGMITENMFCAKRAGTDSCYGDSGGPIISADGKEVQVGIVSWGVGCADNTYPGVYARISSQYSWIRSYICLWNPKYCMSGSISSPPPSPVEIREITTSFDGENGSSGNMFDVKCTAKHDITVVAMDVHILSTISETLELYTKIGSYIGEEQNFSAWTKRGHTTVIGRGEGVATPVNSGMLSPVKIKAQERIAFYITIRSENFIYSDGTEVGNILASNSDLAIYEGIGNIYLFGSMFSPRTWNGSLKYQINTNEVKEIDETVTNLKMTLIGVEPLSVHDQLVWSNTTSNFVHNYYNNEGSVEREGTQVKSNLITTLFQSQYLTVIGENETISSEVLDSSRYLLSDAAANQTEVTIKYYQTLRFETAATDVKVEAVALEPFNTVLQRKNYVEELQSASPGFSKLVAVRGPFIEMEDEEKDNTNIFILAAIVTGFVLLFAFFYSRIRKKRNY